MQKYKTNLVGQIFIYKLFCGILIRRNIFYITVNKVLIFVLKMIYPQSLPFRNNVTICGIFTQNNSYEKDFTFLLCHAERSQSIFGTIRKKLANEFR